mmetsp:Transcript_7070/g.9863  ORF Transcript_7070/g.9863 Transcript_7070/m.9863 type:complete len:90 (+) Transcript_7070:61-330(+)
MATDLSEEIKDLKQSLAYNILDSLQQDGSTTKAEADLLKSKYAKLHEFVLTTYENEKNFLARAQKVEFAASCRARWQDPARFFSRAAGH